MYVLFQNIRLDPVQCTMYIPVPDPAWKKFLEHIEHVPNIGDTRPIGLD